MRNVHFSWLPAAAAQRSAALLCGDAPQAISRFRMNQTLPMAPKPAVGRDAAQHESAGAAQTRAAATSASKISMPVASSTTAVVDTTSQIGLIGALNSTTTEASFARV